MRLIVIPFEQPIGRFFLTVMNAAAIVKISYVKTRKRDPILPQSNEGIQRVISDARIAEISKYAQTTDATFPTPILLAIAEKDCFFDNNNSVEIVEGKIAEIIDGQHRMRGLQQSGMAEEFNIPVVFIVEPSEEQKALMFATINGKQTKVPASLIYDLFGVTEKRSPQKTAHEIARALNGMEESPWKRKLKMLGSKTPGSEESLSQGTFVKQLLPLISANPDEDMERIKKGLIPEKLPYRIFREYFLDDKDPKILKILLNVFNAVKQTWPDEWKNSNDYILTKSVGFTAIMLALPEMYKNGLVKQDLTQVYFAEIFEKVKLKLLEEKLELTNDFFEAGAGAGKLKATILDSLKNDIK
jgi:DGQHR domain-containing protein